MGDLHNLFHRSEIAKPHGRLITCASCGATVDVIEISIDGTPSHMDPERCGQCIADPEPAVGDPT